MKERPADEWWQLALSLYDRQLYREALSAIEQAIALSPGLPLYRRGKGDALAKLGDRLAALRAYAEALEVDRHDRETMNNVGTVFVELGMYDKALLAFDKGLREDPASADMLINRANVLGLLGRGAEAIAGYERALALKPESAVGWNDLAINAAAHRSARAGAGLRGARPRGRRAVCERLAEQGRRPPRPQAVRGGVAGVRAGARARRGAGGGVEQHGQLLSGPAAVRAGGGRLRAGCRVGPAAGGAVAKQGTRVGEIESARGGGGSAQTSAGYRRSSG